MYAVIKTGSKQYRVITSDRMRLGFDAVGHLVTTEDAFGNLNRYHYDGDLLVEVEDDTAHVIRYSYTNGDLTALTDENGEELAALALFLLNFHEKKD